MIGKMVNQAFEENADMEKFEDPVVKLISKRWKICYTEGKKKKKRGSHMKELVSIIFMKVVTSAIQILVKNRWSVNISVDNHFCCKWVWLKGY